MLAIAAAALVASQSPASLILNCIGYRNGISSEPFEERFNISLNFDQMKASKEFEYSQGKISFSSEYVAMIEFDTNGADGHPYSFEIYINRYSLEYWDGGYKGHCTRLLNRQF